MSNPSSKQVPSLQWSGKECFIVNSTEHYASYSDAKNRYDELDAKGRKAYITHFKEGAVDGINMDSNLEAWAKSFWAAQGVTD